MSFYATHSHCGMMVEPKHGHDYKVVLSFEGEPNEEGFVVDFRAMKRLFNKLIKSQLEGTDLDTRFKFATAENLAIWVWDELTPYFPLYSVEVKEKPHSSAVYFGKTT